MKILRKLLKPLPFVFGFIASCFAFAGCGQPDAEWEHGAGNWKETGGVYFGLICKDDAPEGAIDDSKVQSDLVMEIGKDYYYIIDFAVQPEADNSGTEKLTVSVKFNAETALSADLEETSSGDFKSVLNGDEREISINYTIPDNSATQYKRRIVLGLTPKISSEIAAQISFVSKVNLHGLPETVSDSLDVNYTKNLKYEENSQGGYTVYKGKITDENVIIPLMKDGKLITEIGEEAFREYTKLKTIIIPDSVEIIGKDAFNSCNNLQYNKQGEICYLGNEVNPYMVLAKLSTVTLKENEYFAINENFRIHENTKIILNNVFYKCYIEKTITIPDSVTCIGAWAFAHSSISSVALPDSVISIGDSAFYYCTELTEISIGSGVKTIGDDAFDYCSKLSGITIPESVTLIGDGAFMNCSSLTDITIPDGVTGIGSYMFCHCSSLTSIIIPESVTSIGDSAFSGCSSLKRIIFEGSNTQWGLIPKGDEWDNSTGKYTVICEKRY